MAALRLDLEPFLQHSDDPFVLLDHDLKVVESNPAFARDLAPLHPGQDLVELCLASEREQVKLALRESATGSQRSFEASIVLANHRPQVREWTSIADPARGLLLVVLRRSVARLRMETELAEARKLEAVGQLSSGIAHELNTPIQFVGDNLSFIGESLREIFVMLQAVQRHESAHTLIPEALELPYLMEELPRAVEQASEGVQRVAELVRGLKEFAHQDRGEVTLTDINRALERTLTVARNEWKYAAALETSFENLPLVACQASSIRQVLLNLICNAAQAIAERNERTGRGQGLLRIVTSSDGEMVTVAITDNGTGIPEAARDRVFEPFFTTKPVGKGTGQGLALSHEIVCAKHGGLIDFETELGVGTTFRVQLPIRARDEVD